MTAPAPTKIKFRKPRAVWEQPVMKGYKLACCDCGLVHQLDFRIVGVRRLAVQFRAKRLEKLTKAYRKQEGITVR